MANKHNQKHVPGAGVGQCIVRKPDPKTGVMVPCQNPRVPPSWYCAECNADWERDRQINRGQSKGDGRTIVIPGGPHVFDPDPESDLIRTRSGATSTGHGLTTGSDWSRFDHKVGSSPYYAGAGVKLLDRPACDNGGHTGRTPVYTFPDGRVLYGAQGSKLNQMDNVQHLDLIIDCANLVQGGNRFVKAAPSRRFAALNFCGFPDVLKLDWPDMTAPVHIGIKFWTRLLELLPGHTAVCCVGSHGRTGTALACLLVASGMDPETAIVTVRTKHCRRAIETTGQEAYIRGLVTAAPGHPAPGHPAPAKGEK